MQLMRRKPVQPVHSPGTKRGEEMALQHGQEPGRGRKIYSSARDSTGINAEAKGPIHPAMPSIPPA